MLKEAEVAGVLLSTLKGFARAAYASKSIKIKTIRELLGHRFTKYILVENGRLAPTIRTFETTYSESSFPGTSMGTGS